jgi:hypothetical protein
MDRTLSVCAWLNLFFYYAVGFGKRNDGLPLCKMWAYCAVFLLPVIFVGPVLVFLIKSAFLFWRYPLYNWLCYGWAWKVRTKISCGFEVCSCHIITVLAAEIASLCVCFCHICFVMLNADCLRCRIAKDPRFKRLACTHKGTYADDCIVDRITQVEFWLLELFFVRLQSKYKLCSVPLGGGL